MTAIDPAVFAQALADVHSLTPAAVRHSGHVQPQQRARVWAEMAVDLEAEGRSLPGIAAALCVSEDTAAHLLGAPAEMGVAG